MSVLKSKRRHTGGVTLTEMVVASALLMTGIVPILRALNVAQATSRQIEQKTCSLTLAQAEIATCRSRAASDYASSLAVSNAVLTGSYLSTVTDDGDAACKTIVISTGFDRDGNGTLASSEILVTLSTRIAKR